MMKNTHKKIYKKIFRFPANKLEQKNKKGIYSGPCANRHLSFLTSCDIRQKFIVPDYFC